MNVFSNFDNFDNSNGPEKAFMLGRSRKIEENMPRA
jgi:hypothetical protein